MKNLIRTAGILVQILTMFLTMGTGIAAETVNPPIEEEPSKPGLSVDMVTLKEHYLPGEIIEYTVKIINTGDMALTDLLLTDELLGEKTLGDLDVGEELTLKEVYTIPSEYQLGTLENKVKATCILGETEVEAEASFSVEIRESLREKDTVEEVMDNSENTTESPEVVSEDEGKSADIGLMALATDYPATTGVMGLKMDSINQHTGVIYAWMHKNNGSYDTYLAIVSLDTKPVNKITFNGYEYSKDKGNLIVDRADGDYELIIGGEEYGKAKDHLDKDNSKRWSVVKIPGQTLTLPFYITIDVGAGGHNIDDETRVDIDSELEVYHKYDRESSVELDIYQSGHLKKPQYVGDYFRYSVHPVYVKNGVGYELVDIKIVHNGMELGPDVPREWDQDGNLLGEVEPIEEVIDGQTRYYASARITFIYERIDDGELTIIKELSNNSSDEDGSRVFDIFIYGPDGDDRKVYVVTLTPGTQATLAGLKYGEYTIEEIVPMNFTQKSISSKTITLNMQNKISTVTITNERTNDGWFYDDDRKDNHFTVLGVK